ncbi:hypothetical protein Q31b_58410 [Novipirellula aureliae]|uniref:Uncharacterized protein n=1 Tax=Novipirellula aureliae TaxID=2527966 RepID=A0A5C6D9K9_9BACT|nr:hypothetical protein [Novipirellula aureliae]TWU32441.1 hypothetical protein Q31b_58410 [Novipirellula aureliae]
MNSDLAHLEVHFEAIGPDARIHELSQGNDASVDSKVGMLGENYRINIFLGETRDESEAVDLAAVWLESRTAQLASLESRNIIEFCTMFGRKDGSRILALEPEFWRLAADANCVVWNQACQHMNRGAN